MSRLDELSVKHHGWPLPPDGKYDIRAQCGEALDYLEAMAADHVAITAQSSAAQRIDTSRSKRGAHQKQELERVRLRLDRDREKICAAYKSGTSGIMLARKYACDPKEIYVLLREYGVKIRPAPNSEEWKKEKRLNG